MAALAAAVGESFEEQRGIEGDFRCGDCFAARVTARERSVAFLAGERLMPAGEREGRVRMIEAWHCLPGILPMALEAVGAFLSAVDVLVAVRTFATKA